MTMLANAEYDFIRKVVHEHSRIHLGPDKQSLVARRVQHRLSALGLPDFATYCKYLRSAGGREELTALTDVISTNVTQFFREAQHFDFLRDQVLPAHAAACSASRQRDFHVWSAACSSGEEPYSIAMVLAEFFSDKPESSWRVDASDISTRMLAEAGQAIYPLDRLQLPNPSWLRRYFQRGVGRWEGCCRVKTSLRERVCLHHLNLFQAEWPISGEIDVIFCRNVMIYFARDAQEQLVQRLSRLLRVGGYLFVGHAESLIGIRHSLRGVKPSIYRREQ